jgi:hypothetical protein
MLYEKKKIRNNKTEKKEKKKGNATSGYRASHKPGQMQSDLLLGDQMYSYQYHTVRPRSTTPPI